MKIVKIIVSATGFISLVLGAIGIVLPILPTTPFILLSAICFSYSSPKAEKWLSKSKHFGCYIENYKHHTGVPREVKIQSIQFMWCCLALSCIIVRKLWLCILLAVIGIAVTIHIHCLKTKE